MKRQRAVPPSLDDAIAILDSFAACRLEPVAFDRPRHADHVALNVEHHQKLSAAVVDLPGQRGAGPGGEQDSRRFRLAAHGHAVGVSGQQRAPKFNLVNMLTISRAEKPPGGGGELSRVVAGELLADLDHLFCAATLDDHTSEARMDRPATELTKIPELRQQIDGRIDALFRRALEPLECFWIAAPGEDVE